MIRRLTLLIIALFIPSILLAQGGTTAVTGQVLDPLGTPYVNSAVSISFYDPGTPGKIPLLCGSDFQKQYSGYSTDSYGNLPPIQLPDNGVIDGCSGTVNTQWNFNICYVSGLPCFAFKVHIACSTNSPVTCTSNSMNFTPFIQAIPPPTLTGGGGGGGPSAASLPCNNVAYNATMSFGVLNNACYSTTLTGNMTFTTTSTPQNGNVLKLQFTQDGVGGHTVTFPANFNNPPPWVLFTAPNARNDLSWVYDKPNNVWQPLAAFTPNSILGQAGALGTYTVATLPSSPFTNQLVVVTDSTGGSCSVGAGGQRILCQWNGSAWFPAGGGGGGSPGGFNSDAQCNQTGAFGNCSGLSVNQKGDQVFFGPSPYVDVRAFGVRPLILGAAPSTTGITGSITSGTNTLTISTNSCGSQTAVGGVCFLNNGVDGIVVYGAGATSSLATPAAPTVTPSVEGGATNTNSSVTGPTGATAYQYYVIAVDRAGGYSAPSAATSIANGQASLGWQTVNITSCSRTNNIATCTTASPHTLAVGAVVSVIDTTDDMNFGGFQKVDTVPDNTHFTFTNGIDLSLGNNVIQSNAVFAPSSAQSNGTSSTGGKAQWANLNHITFTAVTNAWEYCVYGRTAGSITWLGCSRPSGYAGAPGTNVQELLFDDYGSPMNDNRLRPAWMPSALPGGAQNDWLVTNVASVSGTTLTLGTTASNTVAGAIVRHDNVTPLTNAITYANQANNDNWQLMFPVMPSNCKPCAYEFNSYMKFPPAISVAFAGPLWLNATMELGSGDVWIGDQNMPGYGIQGLAQSWGASVYTNEAFPGIYGQPYGYVFRHINFTSNVQNGAADMIFDMVQPFTMEDCNVVGGSNSGNGTGLDVAITFRGGAGHGLTGSLGSSSYVMEFRNVAFGGGGTNFYPNYNTTAPAFFCNGCGLTTLKNVQLVSGRGVAVVGGNLNWTGGRVQGGMTPLLTILDPGGFGTAIYSWEHYEMDTYYAPAVANYSGTAGTVTNTIKLKQVGCPSATANTYMALFSGRPFRAITMDLPNASSPCSISGQNHDVVSSSSDADILYPFWSTSSSANPVFGIKEMAFMHFQGNQRLYFDLTTPAAPVATPALGGSLTQPSTYYWFVIPVGFDGGLGPKSYASNGCVTDATHQSCSLTWTPQAGVATWLVGGNNNGGSTICLTYSLPGGTTSVTATSTGNNYGCPNGWASSGVSYMGRTETGTPQLRFTSPTTGFSGLLVDSAVTANRTYTLPDASGTVALTSNIAATNFTAFDNFNRSNGAIGSNWTANSGTLLVSSNTVKESVNSGVSYNNTVVTGADQYSEVAIIVPPLVDPQDQIGPTVRNAGIGVATYYVYMCRGNVGRVIFRVLAGSFTQIAGPTGVAATPCFLNDVMRLQVQGTQVTAFYNGVQDMTVSDSQISSGNPGVSINGSTTNPTADNWNGGQLVPYDSPTLEQSWSIPQHFQAVTVGSTTPVTGTLPRGLYLDSSDTGTTLSVFNTPSATVNANIAAANMVASTSAEHTYLYQWTVSLVTPGTSCTGNTTVEVDAVYTDPNGAGSQTQNLGVITIASGGNGTAGMVGTGVDNIRAKTGTAVQYQTSNFTAGTGCSPAPTYKIYPVLSQVN